jgi:hypothetical protein
MAGETLRILSGAGAGTQITLQGDFVVGRSETGMGNLAGDSEISRRHARFQQTAYGQVVVEDLGSTNGTHVNGQRLVGPHLLAPGDQITLGKTILQFDGAPQAPPPPQPPAPAPPVGAGAYGGGQGFAGGPIGGPPGAVPPSSRPRWLPYAAIAAAVLIVVVAVIAVVANSGSDKGKPPAIQTVATPTQSTPAPSAPAQPPAVQSVSALEGSLKSTLNGVSSSGPRVTQVTCPANAPAAAGATFTCSLQGQQGLTGTAQVTLKDARRKAYAFKASIRGNGFTRTVSGTVR